MTYYMSIITIHNSLYNKYKQYEVYDTRTKYRMLTTERIWY